MGDFGERVVGERLLDLDGLARLDELVNVRGHRRKDIVPAMQVRSAVIPAAGLGTRFLPATKAVPKELFPIGDQPAIQVVIDEALGAGIDHIVIVSSRDKPAVAEYFAPNEELLAALDEKGKTETADRLRAIGRDWRVSIVYQDNPKGLGHAVGCAREAVGDEPFAVMLPDEIMSSSSLLAQMNGVCASTGGSVVAVAEVPPHQVSSYGVIDPSGPMVDGVIPVKDLVEKPPVDEAPSNFIITGRYVLTADAWGEIDALTPGRGGELQLTDALKAQAARSPFHAVLSDVGRYDTGNPLGFLTASIQLGLTNPELGDDLRAFLETL
jgi:UTP--glucose-1-phosphate uridylyltransferase